MAVNKEQAERCRELGAEAMQVRDWDRAIKFLTKSLQLHPLPGVEALLEQARRMKQSSQNNNSQSQNGSGGSNRNASTRQSAPAAAAAAPAPSHAPLNAANGSSSRDRTGPDGRSYTQEQADVAQRVLRNKQQGGRGAHYRVLQLERNCSDADIKKAYRKLALKLHPDKNAAPHAGEAFKAVGLAYATLSDPQKRREYDRTGHEDPDNRGGGGGGFGGRAAAADVNPEDIFNMFFGGGIPGAAFQTGGGNGFHVYTTGFGPGMQFRAGRQRGGGGGPAGQRPAQQRHDEPHANIFNMLLQLLPVVLIACFSLFRSGDQDTRGTMPGVNKYFSLTYKAPFVNRLDTRLTKVKNIPFYVDDRFMHSFYRNRHQLGQVEQMVQNAYEDYLVKECKTQLEYKKQLAASANQQQQQHGVSEEAKRKAQERAAAFALSRCEELEDLFPQRKRGNGYKT